MAEAFICDFVRTPIGRYGGALSSVRPDDLAAHVVRAIAARNSSLDPSLIDEVVLGCANQAGEDNRNIARMAVLLAGLPQTLPATTINRLCGSGMDAILVAARAIRSGEADIILAGGAESMSRAPLVMPKASEAFSRRAEIHDTTIGWRFINPAMQAAYGTDSMPETAENVAAEYAISRNDQDAFALRSQERAANAIASGRMGEEIISVEVAQGKGPPIIVSVDEHPRKTTMEKLASLASPFRKNGSVTAGNASGVNDGAACLLIASEDAIKQHGLLPIARILGGATAGVAPRVMGVGPVPATQRLCARLRVSPAEFDVVELNEAFAAQALAVLRALHLPDDAPFINPNGGAIALGHPLGMSGARITGTAAVQLKHTGGRRALATMCVGVGQGIAIAIERT
jgi:acetyl-CoA acyltransferase